MFAISWDVIIERVREVGKDVETITEAHRNFVENDWVKLVLDGRQRLKTQGHVSELRG